MLVGEDESKFPRDLDWGSSKLSCMISQLKSLLSLINDVLDISKIESQKLTLEVAPFDLNALLARISSMFEQSAEQKGINWKVDNQLPTDIWFEGDVMRIEQILLNL